MKKGLIITLALTLMILFVGCGLSSQLAGTKWTRTVTKETYFVDNYTYTATYTYEFNDDDTFKRTLIYDYPTELINYGYEDSTYEYTGSWYCNDNRLYLEFENDPEGEFYDVVILEDELILKNGSDFEKYEKVD